MTVRMLASAVALLPALAACSGGGVGSVEPGTPSRPPSGSTSGSASSSAGAPATSTDTPLPTTTAAGTVLALGETGTVAWQVDAGTLGTVELVVAGVRRKPASVLAGWAPVDQVADTTPYFVRARVTNAGETELGGAALPLYLRDVNGVLTPAATFGSDFTRCPSTPLPDPFAPGEVAELCLVYTLAPNAGPDAMTFQPTSAELGVAWPVG